MKHVAIIGGGFCGLAAGYELSKRGIRVTVLEADDEIGGLAGSFRTEGVRLEKFYHHWFTNDEHIMDLIKEIGTQDQVVFKQTRTGMYYANSFFKLSTPLDLLRFSPLSLLNRIRLGLLTLRARKVDNWRTLEDLTAAEWLRRMAGDEVYRVVWEPLLRGKFGQFAPEVSAVWFWNKLKLRGGSRGNKGEEQLAYYRGGFATLADRIADRIMLSGGQVLTGARVDSLKVREGEVTGAVFGTTCVDADAVVVTTALPIFADLVEPHVTPDYVDSLRRIQYLAGLCLVLELEHSLSDTYWLNVNDPDFPFVAVIEHTNLEPNTLYGGYHMVYLSKYLPASDELFGKTASDLLEFAIPHLQRMFPEFKRSWIRNYYLWRARYAQPIVECRYSTLIPPYETPLKNLYLSTMAQIYPEDRGTNYAVREGRHVANLVAQKLG